MVKWDYHPSWLLDIEPSNEAAQEGGFSIDALSLGRDRAVREHKIHEILTECACRAHSHVVLSRVVARNTCSFSN